MGPSEARQFVAHARFALAGLAVLVALLFGSAAYAVFSGDMSERARSGDSDYADGIEAFDAENWQGVVESMGKVVERRPHHDNAWGRLGYAYRKLGLYEEALEAYHRSLELNPHNRASLEYLGQAYLELHWREEAREVLERLWRECRRVALAFTDGSFSSGCSEYEELRASLEAYWAEHGLGPLPSPTSGAGS